MPNSILKNGLKFDTPATFRIRVQGELDEKWSDRLGGMRITVHRPANKPPESALTGRLLDQAALTGVLQTLYQMHMPLLAVDTIDSD